MSILDQALSLASRGFHVFPLRVNGKLPAIKDFPTRATRDPKQITKWFLTHPNRNLGISTSRFGDDQALVVIDVDLKGKHGDETLLALELQGLDLPSTLSHRTPTGGTHILYATPQPLRQGTDVLGSGLDIRSRGGYVVAPGSTIEGKAYQQINGYAVVAEAPAWLVSRLGVDAGRVCSPGPAPVGVDPARAADRATSYLKTAPPAVAGQGGDTTTYKVLAALKDYGCTQDQAVMLADEHWNDRCSPPWTLEELDQLAAHAFKYGREAPGSSAPEAIFEPVEPGPEEAAAPVKLHPFAEINRSYAFIKQGAYILQETTDEDGAFATERLTVIEFNAWFANVPFQVGDQKPKPISSHWMSWSGRRQYDGVIFMPEKDMGPRWYNLWQGFTVKPAATPNHPALKMFLDHALQNVCNGDEKLFTYLMGYFAHLIQRPWEKPLVALVFKGGKGVGKNALVERVGYLLGAHFLVADDERYLLGNFNSHLESNLLFVLDEACWAGEKRAEGKLKGLITGQKHLIEHKGKEARTRRNLSRIIILGNEDWLVPASQDERRFAVFAVGDGRKQDRKFFEDMRLGMEAGGYAHLLAYLQAFDLSQVDINDAPNTSALTEQKLAGMGLIQEWWFDCLTSGQLAGGDWGGEWPDSVPTNRLREAYARWARGRNVKGRLETEDSFGKRLTKMAPRYVKKKVANKKEGDTSYARFTPGLDKLRADFNKFINGDIPWPTE